MANGQKGTIEFQRINTKDLVPHPLAQRDFVPSHAAKIAREFKWDKYDPIMVSFRDGKYWVIDGQHRLAAIRQNAGRDVTIICRVYYGLTEVDEAEMFLRKGVTTKRLSVLDTFKVLYKIGDEAIVGMVKNADRAGWIVDFKNNNRRSGAINAVEALKRCYDAVPTDVFVEALAILKEAWNGDRDSVCGPMLRGMTLFVKVFDGKYNRKGLIDNLKKVPVAEVIRAAKTFQTTIYGGYTGLNAGRPYAKAIWTLYNKSRRAGKLPDIL